MKICQNRSRRLKLLFEKSFRATRAQKTSFHKNFRASRGSNRYRWFTALAAAAKQRIDDFNAQNLVNTAWALMNVAAQAQGIIYFGPLDLANAARALARAAAPPRESEFKPQDLANTAWA